MWYLCHNTWKRSQISDEYTTSIVQLQHTTYSHNHVDSLSKKNKERKKIAQFDLIIKYKTQPASKNLFYSRAVRYDSYSIIASLALRLYHLSLILVIHQANTTQDTKQHVYIFNYYRRDKQVTWRINRPSINRPSLKAMSQHEFFALTAPTSPIPLTTHTRASLLNSTPSSRTGTRILIERSK